MAAPDGHAPPRATAAIARFVLGSLAAIAVVVVGGFFALRSVAVREAERDTRQRVVLQGALVASAGLSDGILRGDRRALARLDDLVVARLLSPSVVRVKLWSRDGRVLYSDEPAIIGQRFRLGAEERELFVNGRADAELSDLSKPENRYERQEGKLLEAHTAIRTPGGTPVLFETYQRFDAVSASGERLLHALAPTLVAALAVLLLFQVPLAWSLARRWPTTPPGAAPTRRPRRCGRAAGGCGTACGRCGRCSWRSTRRASSRPGWRPR